MLIQLRVQLIYLNVIAWINTEAAQAHSNRQETGFVPNKGMPVILQFRGPNSNLLLTTLFHYSTIQTTSLQDYPSHAEADSTSHLLLDS